MKRRHRILATLGSLLLAAAGARADTGDYRNLGYLYLSPLPGAEYTSTKTKFVLVRFKDISPSLVTNLSQFIEVSGASSGHHAGQTKIAGDNRTVIFEMEVPFQANESVTVHLAPQLPAGGGEPYQYQFMISAHMPDATQALAIDDKASTAALAPESYGTPAEPEENPTPMPPADGPVALAPLPTRPMANAPVATPGKSGVMPNGVSVPCDFPHINITINDNPDAGLIFANNHTSAQRYNVIFDNAGSPVWYLRTSDRRLDMKVQPNGMLTMVTHTGWSRHIGLNNHYEEVASYYPVNGYAMDEHELQMHADGTYFLIC